LNPVESQSIGEIPPKTWLTGTLYNVKSNISADLTESFLLGMLTVELG
jgi:hypothetical protein